jgi:hypothetical protein
MSQRVNVLGIAIAVICAAFVVAVAVWLPTAAAIGPYDGIGTATATGADCADQKKS